MTDSLQRWAELARRRDRPDAAARLAARLGASALLLFVRDEALSAFLPAPGLPQTIPGGPGWRRLLESCRTPGEHRGEVAWPDRKALAQAVALSTEDGLVFALVGGEPRLDEAPVGLFPFLTATLRAELEAEAASGAVSAARAEARQATTLTSVLDATRADLERALAEASRLNAELKTADQRKDEFLAMLAHELRNPLAPVISALAILRREGPHGRSQARLLDVIDRQTRQLTRLVEDLLDVSRINSGRVALRSESVWLGTCLMEAVESVQPLIDSREHELSVEIPDEPLYVTGDQVRLTQVFVNLLANAAKYTAPGGHLALRIEERGSHQLVISVKDDGIGIEPAFLPHVFDLFMQAPRAIDRAEGGLGIGLTLVRGLVQRHGGTVEARSPGPGKGSEFIVRLPRALAPERTIPPRALSTPSLAGLRVLVVDDNEDAAELLAEGLRLAGLEVDVAGDGPSGLARALELSPNAVILDIGLPGMDGFEVARNLRRELPGVTLLALSGYGGDEYRARARVAGFDSYLVKPIDLDTLLRGLDAARPRPLLKSAGTIP